VSWQIDKVNQMIHFIVSGPKSVYIGIGFKIGDSLSTMIGYNYYICFIDSQGKFQIIDYYDENNSQQPDITTSFITKDMEGTSNIQGSRANYYFSRSLITPNANDIVFGNYLIGVQGAAGVDNCLDAPALCTVSHTLQDYGQTLNFITGDIVATATDIWDAGTQLCVAFAIVFGSWAIVRYAHKAQKVIERCGTAPNRKAIASNEKNTGTDSKSMNVQLAAISPTAANHSNYTDRQWKDQWFQLTAESGEVYYFHERLNETAWEIPPVPQWFIDENESTYDKPSNFTSINTSYDNCNNGSGRTGRSGSVFRQAPSAIAARYLLAKQLSKDSSPMQNLFTAVFEYRIPLSQWSMRELLLVAVYIILNVLVAEVDHNAYWLTEQRWGYLAARNCVLVMIPCVRNSVFSMIFGVPFERIIVFHRFLGRWMLLVVTVHMALYIQSWNKANIDAMQQLFHTNAGFNGFLSWMFLVFLNATSVEYFRRNHYNIFYYWHMSFLLVYIFAFIHCVDAAQIKVFIISAACLYGLDRVLRFVWASHISKSVEIILKDAGVIQVRFKKHPIARWLGLYKVGQYVFITFPTMSVRSFFESHPFTLTSGPDELTGEVNIRGLGDYTLQLQEYCRNELPVTDKMLWISVEGPYGNLRLSYWRYPSIVLVSAGIGIAPIISILKDVYRFGDLPVNLKGRNPLDIIESIIAVWIIPDPNTFAWFAKELHEFNRFAAQNPNFPSLNIWIYYTRNDTETALDNGNSAGGIPSHNFKYGKPSFDEILNASLQVNG
jgi:predicted ferric reductase